MLAFSAAQADPQVYYYHLDQLGTPQAMTDANQAVVWRADYEPFGQAAVTVQTVVNNPLRLPGQYYDTETGLHYNYYRDYDPTTGRYLQSDPIGLYGGLNAYLYANANPLNYTDPLGLNPGVGCVAGSWAGPVGCGVGAAIGTAVMGGVALAAILSKPGDTVQDDTKKQCEDDKPCPPCKTISGKVVPVGTIAYRPLDTPTAGTVQHGITGPHYNIYKANQAPKNSPQPCKCFWQPVGAVPPSALPSGAIPIEPFAN